MPTSPFLQLNEIVQLIVRTDPRKLLDIGIGFGKYGFLAREYLELWDGRERYADWQRQVDGIEVFKDYLTPVHDYIYDRVFVGNAPDLLPGLDSDYDLILLVDVLEHFSYDDGVRLLSECRQHGRNVLISTPENLYAQGAAFGNAYETHLFQWKPAHFRGFPDSFVVPEVGGSFLVYLGEDSRTIRAYWNDRKSASPLRRSYSVARRLAGQTLSALRLKGSVERLMGRS